jgi:hypothetical protein
MANDNITAAVTAASGMNLIIVTKLYEKGLLDDADMFEIASKMKSMAGAVGAEDAVQTWIDLITKWPSGQHNAK